MPTEGIDSVTVTVLLSESELAIFDLMQKPTLAATERERIKQSSRELLVELLRIIEPLDQWTENEQTRAEVETVILDRVFLLPEPPYTPEDKDAMAKMLYEHVWQQSMGGRFGSVAPRASWWSAPHWARGQLRVLVTVRYGRSRQWDHRLTWWKAQRDESPLLGAD